MGSSVPTVKTHIKETCILVTQDAVTGQILKFVEIGPNIITDVGDTYYAQRGAGETPTYNFVTFGNMVVARSFTATAGKTNTFGNFVLQQTASATTYWGRQPFDSGYPTTADSDTSNTGRTVDAITYKRIYTTAQANGTIQAIGICRTDAITNTNGQLLSFKTLTVAQQLTKTSSVTLTVYINHLFSGV